MISPEEIEELISIMGIRPNKMRRLRAEEQAIKFFLLHFNESDCYSPKEIEDYPDLSLFLGDLSETNPYVDVEDVKQRFIQIINEMRYDENRYFDSLDSQWNSLIDLNPQASLVDKVMSDLVYGTTHLFIDEEYGKRFLQKCLLDNIDNDEYEIIWNKNYDSVYSCLEHLSKSKIIDRYSKYIPKNSETVTKSSFEDQISLEKEVGKVVYEHFRIITSLRDSGLSPDDDKYMGVQQDYINYVGYKYPPEFLDLWAKKTAEMHGILWPA